MFLFLLDYYSLKISERNLNMYKKSFIVIVVLPVLLSISLQCIRRYPDEPENNICKNIPVEDTTRSYLLHSVDLNGNIVQIFTVSVYPKAVYARFYPWVTDTNKVKQLIKKHNLSLYREISSIDQQLEAILCVTDDRRAEYHFTPYGKEGFCNFGADSLVEYAFGVFNDGYFYPTGSIVFKFVDNTPEARIDSLFEAKGFRLLHISPDMPSGKLYWALVTPKSKKNILDLGYELNMIPFVIYAKTELSWTRIICNN